MKLWVVIGILLVVFGVQAFGARTEVEIDNPTVQIQKEKSLNELISGLGYLSHDNVLKLRKHIQKADSDEKASIHKMLLEKLDTEEDSTALRQCMVYLGMFGQNKDSADALIRIMNSEKDRVDRKLAASLIDRVGSEDNLDALLQAIREDKGEIHHGRDIASCAYGSIGSIGGDKAAKILLQLWNSKEYVPGHSLHSMGMTGSPLVLRPIQEVLEQKEHPLRPNAAAGLSTFAVRNRDHKEISEGTLKLLRKYAKDDNPKVRARVLYGFSIIGQPEDLELAKSFVDDPYSIVVSYTENETVKEKTVYPVQEEAQKAISAIENRMLKITKDINLNSPAEN